MSFTRLVWVVAVTGALSGAPQRWDVATDSDWGYAVAMYDIVCKAQGDGHLPDDPVALTKASLRRREDMALAERVADVMAGRHQDEAAFQALLALVQLDRARQSVVVAANCVSGEDRVKLLGAAKCVIEQELALNTVAQTYSVGRRP